MALCSLPWQRKVQEKASLTKGLPPTAAAASCSFGSPAVVQVARKFGHLMSVPAFHLPGPMGRDQTCTAFPKVPGSLLLGHRQDLQAQGR